LERRFHGRTGDRDRGELRDRHRPPVRGGGAALVLAARRKDRLDGLAAELGADHALAVAIDVTRAGRPARAASAAIARFGRIDVLVSNAGVTVGAEFEDLTLEDWRLLMRRRGHRRLPTDVRLGI